MIDREPTDEELQAYLDGELDPGDAARVTFWLASRSEHEAKLDAYRENDALLRTALALVVAEPVPVRLRETVMSRRKPVAAGIQAAVALLLILSGVATGWFGHALLKRGEEPMARMAARAAEAHLVYASDLRHPIEVGAGEKEQLNAWLSRRLQRQVAAPDLSAAGFELLGGRLVSDEGRAAALFMYEGATGQRLSVVVSLGRGSSGPLQATAAQDEVRAMSWNEGPLRVAVAAELGLDRLRGIGEIVAAGLRN